MMKNLMKMPLWLIAFVLAISACNNDKEKEPCPPLDEEGREINHLPYDFLIKFRDKTNGMPLFDQTRGKYKSEDLELFWVIEKDTFTLSHQYERDEYFKVGLPDRYVSQVQSSEFFIKLHEEDTVTVYMSRFYDQDDQCRSFINCTVSFDGELAMESDTFPESEFSKQPTIFIYR